MTRRHYSDAPCELVDPALQAELPARVASGSELSRGVRGGRIALKVPLDDLFFGWLGIFGAFAWNGREELGLRRKE